MSDGYINLNGEDIVRNKAIVQEILDLTGHKLKTLPEPKTEMEKAFRQLTLCNIAVAEQVKKYYDDHPLATNVPELTTIVRNTIASEIMSFSKDDVVSLFILQQTRLAMKRFGYE